MNIHIHKSCIDFRRIKHTYGYAFNYLLTQFTALQVTRLVHIGDIRSGSESHRLGRSSPEIFIMVYTRGVI